MSKDRVEDLAKDIEALSALDTIKLAVGLIERGEKNWGLVTRILELGLVKYRYKEAKRDE